MNVINLTPHEINVEVNGQMIAIQSSGNCRVKVSQETVDKLQWDVQVPVVRNTYGQVEGLPEPQKDTVYVVSLMVLTALGDSRPDVVSPDSGPSAIRKNGQIWAVRNFVTNCKEVSSNVQSPSG